MRFPGYKHLAMGARWLRSRFQHGALILGYHRVSEGRDPYGLCVRPTHFGQHLDVLRQHANVIPLTQLVDGLPHRSLPPRSVVLTFDDGYLDNLQFARPLLEQQSMPATIFVVTGYLGEPFWWDQLAFLLLDAANGPTVWKIEFENHARRWQVADMRSKQDVEMVADRHELLSSVYHCLLALDVAARDDALAQLRRTGISRPAPDRKNDVRAMTPSELRQMADGDLVTIGAHTVRHPVLTRLPAAAQLREIWQSKECLADIIGQPVTAFSYPNGAGDDVTRKLVRRAGFTLACASFNDMARPKSDLCYLPRFWMPDWDGGTFARWLHRWLPA